MGGAFRRPFPEQIAYFRQKMGRRVPTRRWDDLTGAAHDTAFVVAGAQKADLLSDLAASVDRAIAEGTSLETFRQDFRAAVDRNDWHGWTGEGTRAGAAWRTRTIYRTNAAVSYAAGRYAQLQAAGWKYWVYLHGGSKEPRPEHLHVFNGLVLPSDHPFWAKFYPPSDWGCSCYVLGANTLAQARRLGGDPDKSLPDDWEKPDPATGEPAGIGTGWGYAPGASVAGLVSAAAAKIGAWDYQLSKAFMGQLPQAVLDEVADAYRRLPSTGEDVRRYADLSTGASRPQDLPPVRTLGLLTSKDLSALRELGLPNLDGYDFAITPDAVAHIEKRHGPLAERAGDQRPVSAADYAFLPQVVAQPDAIELLGRNAVGETVVQYRREFEGETYFARFAVLGRKRRSLALRTLFVKSG